jgi:cation transport regulator ChaC
MAGVAIFAYGSLASLASAERTLGRPVEHAAAARLPGWRRRWSTVRDNLAAEKTFARPDDGTLPPFCLGLNLEPAAAPAPNGVLVEVTEAELERLDRRELRYRRVEVSREVATADAHPFEGVVTFVARVENFAPSPPAGAVILAPYVRAVEAAFDALGPGQLDLFRETTGPYPVEVIEGVLVRDEIPAGNPREW